MISFDNAFYSTPIIKSLVEKRKTPSKILYSSFVVNTSSYG